MYEAIKNYITTFISKFRQPSKRELMDAEYEVIFQKVKEAKTLRGLIDAKKEIEEYKTAVRDIGSPYWAKNHVVFLVANWERQFKLWKLMRG